MAWHYIRWVLGTVVLLGLLVGFILLTRVDRQPYTEQPYYALARQLIDSIGTRYQPTVGTTLQVGWSRQNITPSQPAHLMGYGWKGDYEQIHDSLEVRTLVFRMDTLSVGLVSYELMLAPPAVVRQVRQELSRLPIDYLYFSAVHTHNGYGGWAEGLGRELIAGPYDSELVHHLVQQTLVSLEQAHESAMPTRVAYARFEIDSLVNNRLVKGGAVDPYLRTLYFQRTDGSHAVFCSYSAHATFLNSQSKDLSADYPGELVRQLEADSTVDFALFAAGAVGSHSPHKPGPFSYEKLQTYAHRLTTPILQSVNRLSYDSVAYLGFGEVALPLGEPQLRLSENWRLRPYWFRKIMGTLHPSLTFLRLGEVILVGTPGDFSGLLYDQLRSREHPLIITSFNGEYVGYLIPSRYYHLNHRETRITNWFGPYTGDYVVDLINQSLPYLAPAPSAKTD